MSKFEYMDTQKKNIEGMTHTRNLTRYLDPHTTHLHVIDRNRYCHKEKEIDLSKFDLFFPDSEYVHIPDNSIMSIFGEKKRTPFLYRKVPDNLFSQDKIAKGLYMAITGKKEMVFFVFLTKDKTLAMGTKPVNHIKKVKHELPILKKAAVQFKKKNNMCD